MGEFVESVICKTTDLQNNEKKIFLLGEGRILLIKQNDKFTAIGSKCSHYSGPLVQGVLYKDHISCPWHGACFSLKTGDIEDFPGCDSLPVYEVTVSGDDVKVKGAKSDLATGIRVKKLSARNSANTETFVVVGGGASGLQCAESLRQEGFTGRVVLISDEDANPYDRTKLSKSLNMTVEELVLRSSEYLSGANIEVMLNTKVTNLDAVNSQMKLDNGSTLKYTKVFLGTGGSPRKYDIKGSELKNIFYLKTHNDANAIAQFATDKNVVISGTSFIGMEVASYLYGKAKSITIVGRSKFPFKSSLGEKIGEQFQKLFELKEIKFYEECDITEFLGVNGELKQILLSTNTVLTADMCVAGIGSVVNLDYLTNTGIQLDHSLVLVNNRFETSLKNVYAGGDMVRFPLSVLGNEVISVGHWQTAQAHGKCAALNMVGKTSYTFVPYFWAAMFGKALRFSGNNDGYTDILVDGSLEDLNFIAYYIKNGEAVAVCAIANDPTAPMFAALLRNGQKITHEELKTNPKKWREQLVV